jgi:hypothetical protein
MLRLSAALMPLSASAGCCLLLAEMSFVPRSAVRLFVCSRCWLLTELATSFVLQVADHLFVCRLSR